MELNEGVGETVRKMKLSKIIASACMLLTVALSLIITRVAEVFISKHHQADR